MNDKRRSIRDIRLYVPPIVKREQKHPELPVRPPSDQNPQSLPTIKPPEEMSQMGPNLGPMCPDCESPLEIRIISRVPIVRIISCTNDKCDYRSDHLRSFLGGSPPDDGDGGRDGDIYLLESGAPDGYELEDGTGVLLLE